ncbi:MAG: hypothetical protein SFV19_12110 [Rhodospirillaceae bacterium]|nr:hypothetical protein [Rhodospirillaceae bacterium]
MLITALRDRLYLSLFAVLAAVLAVAIFVGGSAISEQQQTAVVYAAGAARIVVILGVIVFVATHIERLVESREIEAILSHAISRTEFLLSYGLGLSLVTALIVIPVGVVVGALATSPAGAALWTLSLFLELLIVVAFALFAGLSFERSLPTVFATTGFYAFSRSIGFLLGIATSNVRKQGGINEILNPYVEFLGLLLPRLDLFGQSSWLIYGLEKNLASVLLAQAVVGVALLLGAAAIDLNRKQF